MKSQKSGPFFETRIALSQSLSSCWVLKSCRFFFGTRCHWMDLAGDSMIHPSFMAERRTLRSTVRHMFRVRGATPVSLRSMCPLWISLWLIWLRRISLETKV